MTTYEQFINNRFDRQDVFIVASGPSLIGFDYQLLNNKKVIAVNHSHKLVQHEYCVFVDKGFPEKESPEVLNTTCLTQYNQNYKDKDNIIFFKFSNSFSHNLENGVYHRSSSGSVAICTALHGNANKIYLLGFDCRGVSYDDAKKICLDNGGNVDTIQERFYGHSTSGQFTHNRDSAKNMHIFNSTIQKYSAFTKYKIINLSNISMIPFFEKKDWRSIL